MNHQSLELHTEYFQGAEEDTFINNLQVDLTRQQQEPGIYNREDLRFGIEKLPSKVSLEQVPVQSTSFESHEQL
jgi:hypothetical protein